MANIVNARDKNNNIVYPITKTSLVLDNNGTSVDILLAGKQDSLTSAQMTAANSGITSALVAQITTNATNIGTLQTDVSSLQTTVSNKMDKDNPTGTGSFSLNRLSSGTTGSSSSTLGRNNIASGINSHAAGYYTTAQRRSQQTFGEYNILDTTGSSTSSKGSFIEIVGNGTSTTNRSNARTLDWSGNEVLAGNLRAAGLTDGTTTKTMTEILAGGGSTITVDSALSTTSTNPVQNKVINSALGNKIDKTSNANKVYATDSSGNQTTIDYSSSQTNSANKIVQRDSNSDVLVPTTPSSNNGAASKSYVDDKTVPTEWQTPTINSTYISGGTVRYTQIGDLVIVKLWDIKFTQYAVDNMGSSNTHVIISGLPAGSIGMFCLVNDSNAKQLRIAGLGEYANGRIVSWWSAPASANDVYYGEVVYIKDKYI